MALPRRQQLGLRRSQWLCNWQRRPGRIRQLCWHTNCQRRDRHSAATTDAGTNDAGVNDNNNEERGIHMRAMAGPVPSRCIRHKQTDNQQEPHFMHWRRPWRKTQFILLHHMSRQLWNGVGWFGRQKNSQKQKSHFNSMQAQSYHIFFTHHFYHNFLWPKYYFYRL